jgi:hypothetical protein
MEFGRTRALNRERTLGVVVDIYSIRGYIGNPNI